LNLIFWSASSLQRIPHLSVLLAPALPLIGPLMASGRMGSNSLSEIIGWERPSAIHLIPMVVAAMMRRSFHSFKVGAPSGGSAGSLGRALAFFPYSQSASLSSLGVSRRRHWDRSAPPLCVSQSGSDPLFLSFHSFFNSLKSLFRPFPFSFRIQT
jgi:hypothetical protein